MSGYLGTKAVLLSTTAANVGGSSTVGAGLTVDNDGATVLTVDRATSNGTLVDFQKDGSAVGSLGVNGDRIYLTNAQEGIMIDQSANNLSPTSSTGTFNDNAMNLGESGNRWKDLYLSGGVYLGGTGSANLLEDYEEGTWTPVLSANYTGTYAFQVGTYTKVGNLVSFSFYLETATASGAGNITLGGLPFAAGAGSNRYHAYQGWTNSWDANANVQCLLGAGATYLNMYNIPTSGGVTTTTVADIGSGANIIISGTYTTDA